MEVTEMDEMDIDPVEELHQIRQKLYKKAGGTPEAYVRYIMEQQKQYADRLVDFSKPESVKNTPRRKPAKPAAKISARKSASRRKAVTA
jgi:hypothetical protein